MKSMGAAPPSASRDELAGAVALFHSLSDPTRLAIARRLAGGEARVVDLTGELGLAQSTVSSHLACLARLWAGGFPVSGGPRPVYRLARPELLDMFRAAEAVLEATGNAVALCPNYGHPTERKVGR